VLAILFSITKHRQACAMPANRACSRGMIKAVHQRAEHHMCTLCCWHKKPWCHSHRHQPQTTKHSRPVDTSDAVSSGTCQLSNPALQGCGHAGHSCNWHWPRLCHVPTSFSYNFSLHTTETQQTMELSASQQSRYSAAGSVQSPLHKLDLHGTSWCIQGSSQL